MKKCLLIDGNAMLFRAYYATLYGRMMTTSNGIPTNAVYGFITMINKALDLIKPDHLLVAFDSGKPTFRHETFKEYKGTRRQLDQELIVQFPIAREYLDGMMLPAKEDLLGKTSLKKAWEDLNYGNIVMGYNMAVDSDQVIKRQYLIHEKLLSACKTGTTAQVEQAIADHYLGGVEKLIQKVDKKPEK